MQQAGKPVWMQHRGAGTQHITSPHIKPHPSTQPTPTPHPSHNTQPTHLRALLRRQRKGLAGLQQRLLPPGGLLWQQVAGKLSVDDAWVQRVGCSRGGGGQGKGRGQGRSVCAREQYSGREAMRRGRLI